MSSSYCPICTISHHRNTKLHKVWFYPGKQNVPLNSRYFHKSTVFKKEIKANAIVNTWKVSKFAMWLSPSAFLYLVDIRLGGELGSENCFNNYCDGITHIRFVFFFSSSTFYSYKQFLEHFDSGYLFQMLGSAVPQNVCPGELSSGFACSWRSLLWIATGVA